MTAADARPLGLLRGVVHGGDAGLDAAAGLRDAGLLRVHADGPSVAAVPDSRHWMRALAQHVVGLAEHEAHEVLLVVSRGRAWGIHAGVWLAEPA